MENLDRLINELIKLPSETQWIEFKMNNYDPDMIGEDISALANGATLSERPYAYMLWGIDDETHNIIGTEYKLSELKNGNEELENWLRRLLSNNADFTFHSVQFAEKNVELIIINKAINNPVSFKRTEYVRVGSYTKKLIEYQSVQSQLWERLRNESFEDIFSAVDLNLKEAVSMLDYSTYFENVGTTQPTDLDSIAHYLIEEGCIVKQDNGLYAITNFGAILLCKHLSDFKRLERKAIRVIQYKGNNRLSMLKEDIGTKGYIVGFEGLIKFINALLPSVENISDTFRETIHAYPPIAIREAVANALIHQDFNAKGTGPTVEIFDNRIEITNPGTPLIDIKRIVDNPPRSRNEKTAELARRLRICEELGTGWDKMVISCELQKIPAPRIDLYDNSTRVTIFSQIPFSSLSTEDKLWSCYLHACIKYIQGEQINNSSIRERFGLKETSASSASRLIKEAVEANLIKPLDPTTAPRYMKYIPIWA